MSWAANKEEGKTRPVRLSIGMLMIVLVMLDVVLSIVNFFAFTTDSKQEIDSLFDSLVEGSEAWCVRARCSIGATTSGSAAKR